MEGRWQRSRLHPTRQANSDVSLHHFREFLCNVVFADRVLKRKIEFVIFLKVVEANVLVFIPGTRIFAAAFSALTENVHLSIFLKYFDILLSVAPGLAVRNQANGQMQLVFPATGLMLGFAYQ